MLDPKEFKKNAAPVVDWIDHYLKHITDFPVKSQVAPGEIYRAIPSQAPMEPEALQSIIKDLNKTILPGITHWQHPGFHAYFPANSSVESVLAECITSAIGAQCMIWDTSPAAAELEQRMMEWLRQAMDLPAHFEGVIQDSASSATLVALITAREVATGFRSNEDGVPNNLRVYCSTETHSSIEKAVGVCGIGKRNLVKVGTDKHLAMDPSLLEEAIEKDLKQGLKPCAVVATLGTTSTLAVDPLKKIAVLCKTRKIWLHVDAAYAGTALMLPEYRWMSEGMDMADSFVFNPHKWMFTNFDCSVYFIKDAATLIRTFEVLPEYLKTKSRGQVNDYRDWSVPLGRRFRALKLWFVLRSFGLEGIREKLRTHIRLHQHFCQALSLVNALVMPVEPFLNFSCFRLQPDGIAQVVALNQLNEAFLEEINRSGELFLTHTKIDGYYTIRMLIGQTYVTREHVERAAEKIERAARQVLTNFKHLE